MDRQVIQVPVEYFGIGQESSPRPGARECMCTSLITMNTNDFRSPLVVKTAKNTFIRTIAVYQLPEAVQFK